MIRLTVLALFITGISYAGVKEKKAKRKFYEVTKVSVEKVKKLCGNKNIEIKLEDKSYTDFYKNNKTEIENDKGTEAFLYTYAQRNAEAMLEALAEICKNDADYKDEIAKLTVIKVFPNSKYKSNESVFSLEVEGTKLVSKLSANPTSRSASDYIKKLKKVW